MTTEEKLEIAIEALRLITAGNVNNGKACGRLAKRTLREIREIREEEDK